MLIEVECESNPNQVLNMLYQNTDLQKTFSANQYALVGKTPKLLTLKEYLDIYLNHNYECIKRENIYDCEKSKERLEIVIGLIKALEDIDNIIKLIKESESSEIAKSNLINKYAFTERQAKAILDMKLSKLAHLEKISLNEEKEALTSTISKCNEIIANIDKQKEIYLERFSALVAKYGDARRTELAQISLSRGEKEIIKVEPEKVVVVITEGGLIKRIPVASFKTQRRNTKGVKTQNDITSMIIRTNTIDNLMVFSNKGTMYKILVDNIPEGDNTSKGVHVSSLAKMGTNEVPTLIYSIYRDTNAKYVVFVSKNGLIKKVPLDEYTSITRRTGVAATKFREGDELAAVFLADEEDVLIASNSGMMIRVSANEIPETTKVATGVKGIGLKDDEYVLTALPIRDKNDSLAVFDKDGSAKKISLSEFTCQRRGGRGITYTKGTPAALTLVSDEDKILVVGDKTSVCISATEIASSNRTSLGVKAIKDSAIVSVSKI